jgi:hypothetical protein
MAPTAYASFPARPFKDIDKVIPLLQNLLNFFQNRIDIFGQTPPRHKFFIKDCPTDRKRPDVHVPHFPDTLVAIDTACDNHGETNRTDSFDEGIDIAIVSIREQINPRDAPLLDFFRVANDFLNRATEFTGVINDFPNIGEILDLRVFYER